MNISELFCLFYPKDMLCGSFKCTKGKQIQTSLRLISVSLSNVLYCIYMMYLLYLDVLYISYHHNRIFD